MFRLCKLNWRTHGRSDDIVHSRRPRGKKKKEKGKKKDRRDKPHGLPRSTPPLSSDCCPCLRSLCKRCNRGSARALIGELPPVNRLDRRTGIDDLGPPIARSFCIGLRERGYNQNFIYAQRRKVVICSDLTFDHEKQTSLVYEIFALEEICIYDNSNCPKFR